MLALAVSIKLYKLALALTPAWLLSNIQFLRPIVNGLIARSAGVLSIGYAPFQDPPLDATIGFVGTLMPRPFLMTVAYVTRLYPATPLF